ncbi:hypothetical protein AD006_08670 [Pseudonocardia sp. EC080610-09]|uniref:DUF5667 domain-containing protein n=1 Tax=unclassified Pseudonocardia TaxID=2619320 RepID=UPI0006CB0742|nr:MULTISPECIES: DUF5667 domain-containing protein [unclassified Pseudonocardia]ALE72074.1 hypothetical protein FRP1_01035 [Pseudonocardia sp. EC080625-04]ALL75355.1 hypothetical protein AD006_08670 [Pseudonocardia sp. EC080610-09]ALL82380.1 hypothetical protein AD017_16500 [Pseudonocardia sp. EC080619-01]
MPRAWDDRYPAEDGFDRAPAGAPASEELAHEIALAAALDRSRRDLSPDPHASARMRQRLFDVLAQEGVGRPEQPPAGAPAPRPVGNRSELSDLTAPIGPPIADDLDWEAVSNRASAGERTPVADDPGARSSRSRRGGRHVLPSDHPDHPGLPVGAAAGPARDADAGPGREETVRPSGPRMLDRRRPSVRKRFGVVVGGFAALAVIAGVTSTVSRDALPGDAMYGVKRANESIGGAFTVGDQAEASRQLDLARSRVDELENLMARATPPAPASVAAAMEDFDRAASTGSRMMLTGSGTGGAQAAELAELRTWAAAQSGRISRLQEELPAESRPETAEAVRLLDRVLARAEALRADSGCAADSGGTVDDLGPVPGECRTGGGAPVDASKQSATATATPEGSTAPSSSEAPTSETTSPETSTSESPTSETGSGDSGGGLPLLGGGSSSSSSPSSPSQEKSQDDDGLSITIPPLLPGLGPVTLG